MGEKIALVPMTAGHRNIANSIYLDQFSAATLLYVRTLKQFLPVCQMPATNIVATEALIAMGQTLPFLIQLEAKES
jgi:hypothetical protein